MENSTRTHFGKVISYQPLRIPGELNGEESINDTGPRQVSGVVYYFYASNKRLFQFPFPMNVCVIYRIVSLKSLVH